jgi:large subunit ribosomal protein L9
MKVLLTKSVPHLGLPGDMCTVKDGYARNYLIPHGLAVLGSDPTAKKLLVKLASDRTVAEKDQAAAQENAKSWVGKTATLAVKANPDGTLFGAVTARDVAKSLGVDVKQIQFETTKVAGEFEAILDLGFSVTVQIPVMIMAEGKQRAHRS